MSLTRGDDRMNSCVVVCVTRPAELCPHDFSRFEGMRLCVSVHVLPVDRDALMCMQFGVSRCVYPAAAGRHPTPTPSTVPSECSVEGTEVQSAWDKFWDDFIPVPCDGDAIGAVIHVPSAVSGLGPYATAYHTITSSVGTPLLSLTHLIAFLHVRSHSHAAFLLS